MDKHDARQVTKWVVWGTIVLWIIWDVVVLLKWGSYATESVEIGDAAEYFCTLPLVAGVIGGHFFWKVPRGTERWEHRRVALVTIALAAMATDAWALNAQYVYPLWVVAMLPIAGYVLGHYLWAQYRTRA